VSKAENNSLLNRKQNVFGSLGLLPENREEKSGVKAGFFFLDA
jgi:hypothetical protein